MNKYIAGILTLLCVFSLYADEQRDLPSPEKIKNAQGIIDAIIGDDIEKYEKKKITGTEVSEKLVSLVRDAENDAQKYRILEMAIHYYSCDENVGQAVKTLNTLDAMFKNVPYNALMEKILKTAFRGLNAKNADNHMKTLNEIYEERIHKNDLKSCDLIRSTVRNSRHLRKAEGFEAFCDFQKQHDEQIKYARTLDEIKAKLDKAPDDPNFNFNYAQALASQNVAWEKMSPYLSKIDHPTLVAKLAMEKNGQITKENAREIADQFWDYAETIKGPLVFAFKKRAAFYYAQIEESATGLAKVMIEKRIAEAQKGEPETSEELNLGKLPRKAKAGRLQCEIFKDFKEKSVKNIPKSKSKDIEFIKKIDIPSSVQEKDYFALRIKGYFYAPKSAEYFFELGSDDGSTFEINGKELCNMDKYQGYTKMLKSVKLTAGWHPFTLLYFEGAKDDLLTLKVGTDKTKLEELSIKQIAF